MSKSVQEFLKKIGPRPLTHEEAVELQALRQQAGEATPFNVAEEILKNIEKDKEKKKGSSDSA